MENKIGKFIVIDGTDGAGKKTQTALLREKLENAGYKVRIFDFPQYGKKSAGPFEEYLNGKYGSPLEVGPYRASIMSATDRYDASFEIRKALDEGTIVISNRYVSSNLGHQGGKIRDPYERRKFYDWLDELEYSIFKIPQPDITIILDVPAETGQMLSGNNGRKSYLEDRKRDIHEDDLDHLRDARDAYLELPSIFPGYKTVNCAPDKELLSPSSINEQILRLILPLISDNKEKAKQNITQDPILRIGIARLADLAIMPEKSAFEENTLELYPQTNIRLKYGDKTTVRFGIAVHIPKTHEGYLNLSKKYRKLGLYHTAGLIEDGHTGEITVELVNEGACDIVIPTSHPLSTLKIVKKKHKVIHR